MIRRGSFDGPPGAMDASCNDEQVATVTRLVTFVDVDGATEARQISVSARNEAALEDGRHVLLLDDRGWSESAHPTSGL
jgi:hypothetical protein